MGHDHRPAPGRRRERLVRAEGKVRPRLIPDDDRPRDAPGPAAVAAVHRGEQARPRAVADAVPAPQGRVERAGGDLDRRERQVGTAGRGWQPDGPRREASGREVFRPRRRPSRPGRVHPGRQASRRAAPEQLRQGRRPVAKGGRLHLRLQPPAVRPARARRADPDPLRADRRARRQTGSPGRPRPRRRPDRRRRAGAGWRRRRQGGDRHRRVPLRVAHDDERPDVRPRRREVRGRAGPDRAERAGQAVACGRRRRKGGRRGGRHARRPAPAHRPRSDGCSTEGAGSKR